MKQRIQTVKNWVLNHKYVVFLACVLATGLWMRWLCFPFLSADYTGFLHPWYEEVKKLGGFSALGTRVGNYSPVYLYLIALFTYLPVYDLFLFKAVSVLADIALAAGAGMILYQLTGNARRAALAASAMWMLPTVILNSAFWGQCDAIFTAFLVWMLYFMMRNKPYMACVCYGLAFAFKLQAVFLLPLVVVCLLNGRVKLRHVGCGIAAYALALLPAVIARGDLAVFYSTYAGQVVGTEEVTLSTNVPNLYAWFATYNDTKAMLLPAFILFAVTVVGILTYYLWEKQADFTNEVLLCAAALYAVLIPFVLPCMVERYFYLGDALILIFAMRYPKKLYAALVALLLSFNSYMVFFFTDKIKSEFFAGLFVFIPLVVLVQAMIRLTHRQEP